MNNIEIKRIKNNTNGELPGTKYLKYSLGVIEFPVKKLEMLKQVMIVVSQYDTDNWPIDEKWEIELPHWFIDTINKNKVEDILQDNTLWDFGSWLDAMKFRGWEWFSSKLLSNNSIEIILEPNTFPYSVGPFEYIIKVIGVRQENILLIEF